MCSRGSFLRSKVATTSADHTPSSDAYVRYEWTSTSTPLYASHDVYRAKSVQHVLKVLGDKLLRRIFGPKSARMLRKLHNEIMISIIIENTR